MPSLACPKVDRGAIRGMEVEISTFFKSYRNGQWELFEEKNYYNHINGHSIGLRICFMGYYGRKKDIYGILVVGIKIYGALHTLPNTERPPLHITLTTRKHIYIKQQISIHKSIKHQELPNFMAFTNFSTTTTHKNITILGTQKIDATITSIKPKPHITSTTTHKHITHAHIFAYKNQNVYAIKNIGIYIFQTNKDEM
eukprot:753611_1